MITKNMEEMKIHLVSHDSKEKYLAQFEEVVGGLVAKAKKP